VLDTRKPLIGKRSQATARFLHNAPGTRADASTGETGTMKPRSLALAAPAMAVLGAMALASPGSAEARAIRIDQVEEFFNDRGQAWSSTSYQTQDGAQSWNLPFALTIGGTSYSSLCASTFGVVWFGAATCTSPSSLAELGSLPYFSPTFDAGFVANASPNTINDSGAMSVSRGVINPFDAPYDSGYCDPSTEDGFGGYDVPACLAIEESAGRLYDAFRVQWSYPVAEGAEARLYQLVFLSLDGKDGNGPGAFEVEVNYSGGGFESDGGISAGGQTATLAPTSNGYVFRFGNGGTTPPPTPVPEPGTLGLLGAALGVLALVRRRRSHQAH
jgi:hypothetical protein